MAKTFYAQKDALGYPVPGTLMSVETPSAVPANTLTIPAANTLTSPQNVRKNGMRYFVRKDKSGNIIPNSLIASIKKPSGLVYEFQPTK
jgi:predicted glycosyltransferase